MRGMAAQDLPRVVVLLAVCSMLVGQVYAIRFELTGGTAKCVGEEIMANVLVVGDYSISPENKPPNEKLSVKVTSPYGAVVHQNDHVETGQFGFTTKETGTYTACFWISSSTKGTAMSVQLDWKTGVHAKDWGEIAKKEKLEGLELDLRQLEEDVQEVLLEMTHLREREEKMRDLNEQTNARVAWFSLLSLFACLGVAGWQLWHLKSFFERKKLL